MRNIISIYASYGHKILSFRSDNEASFTSSVVRNTLTEQGVKYQYASPGRHERHAERAIQQLKRGFTATLADLNYRLPCALYDELIVYVTMSCNLITSTSSPILSKREVFTGCAATFHDYHRVEFGQLVTTHRVVRQHDVDPRADVGLILNRDMKSLGGACILDLVTGEIRTRHDYKPIAWSAADIRRLYELTEPGGVGTHVEEATFGIAVGDEDYDRIPCKKRKTQRYGTVQIQTTVRYRYRIHGRREQESHQRDTTSDVMIPSRRPSES